MCTRDLCVVCCIVCCGVCVCLCMCVVCYVVCVCLGVVLCCVVLCGACCKECCVPTVVLGVSAVLMDMSVPPTPELLGLKQGVVLYSGLPACHADCFALLTHWFASGLVVREIFLGELNDTFCPFHSPSAHHEQRENLRGEKSPTKSATLATATSTTPNARNCHFPPRTVAQPTLLSSELRGKLFAHVSPLIFFSPQLSTDSTTEVQADPMPDTNEGRAKPPHATPQLAFFLTTATARNLEAFLSFCKQHIHQYQAFITEIKVMSSRSTS